MELIRTHPFTTLAIVVTTAYVLIGWLIVRRTSPLTTPYKAARRLYLGGVVLMVLGVGRTVLNIVDGRFPPDIFFFIGLFAFWAGWTASRTTNRTDSTSRS